MQIHVHADKIRRMGQLRERLDPLADFELWYWTTLTAGTNIWNAVLHLAGITSEERVFSTIPGVHVVPQADGSYRRELRGPGDVSHVGWPPIPGAMPEHVRRLEQALHALEEYRDPCLRGGRKPTQQIVDACAQAFDSAHAIFQQAIREKTP